jgi:hypothetical protein
MSDTIPTIERDPTWPKWAQWYAVDYCNSERWVYELEPAAAKKRPWWRNLDGRMTRLSTGDCHYPFWFASKRRIVDPEPVTFSLPQAVEAEMAMAPLFAVIEEFALRLTLLGHACHAYDTLQQHGIPIPALVVREAQQQRDAQ